MHRPNTLSQSRQVSRRERVVEIEKLMDSADLTEAAVETDATLSHTRFVSAQFLASVHSIPLESLADESGLVIGNDASDPRIIQRSTLEQEVLDDIVWPIYLKGYHSLVDVIELTASVYQSKASVGNRRIGNIGLLDGDGKVSVLFVPSQELGHLESQISAIFAAPGSPLIRATLIFFAIVHYHPFSDGNGRIARTIFNLLLRCGGLPDDQYLPLFELMHRSQGGYEIALRNAEVFGNWNPLVRFMVSAFKIASAA